MPRECWLYDTFQGEFRIEPTSLAGRPCYAVLWDNELLGCFDSPEIAATHLAYGQMRRPSCGLDLSRLGLPPALAAWVYVPPCHASYDRQVAPEAARYPLSR